MGLELGGGLEFGFGVRVWVWVWVWAWARDWDWVRARVKVRVCTEHSSKSLASISMKSLTTLHVRPCTVEFQWDRLLV